MQFKCVRAHKRISYNKCEWRKAGKKEQLKEMQKIKPPVVVPARRLARRFRATFIHVIIY